MNQKKIIAVIGASGTQGSGLVRAILNDPQSEFAVRAITREPNSEKANELAALGAEVVQADVDDVKSLEAAFAGAYGAFLVSFYWPHMDAVRETQTVKNMAVATKLTRVQHVIYSTLEDTRHFLSLEDDSIPTIKGRYKVPFLDSKGEANRFFVDLGIPTTFLLTSFYWENFYTMAPQRQDGELQLKINFGNAKLAGLAAEDIGNCTYAIFKQKEAFIGKTVGISGDQLTFHEIADAFSEALGEKVHYAPFSNEEYRALAGMEAANSFQWMTDFNKEFLEARSLDFSRSLNPAMQTLKKWLETNKERISID